MGVNKIRSSQERKKKVLERYKNRVPLPSMTDRKQLDIQIIDKALTSLYNDGDKITRSLQEEILKPQNILLTPNDTERIWDVMVNTGLVHAVIGFGNSGKLDLTTEGYQLMAQFGSYSAFIEERQRQMQQQQGFSLPQFIIEQADPEQKGGDDDAKQAVSRKK